MFVQVGKKKNAVHPGLVGAAGMAGMVIGATAIALSDQENRKKLSKHITKLSKTAKESMHQLQHKASQLQNTSKEETPAEVGDEGEKTAKTKLAGAKEMYTGQFGRKN